MTAGRVGYTLLEVTCGGFAVSRGPCRPATPSANSDPKWMQVRLSFCLVNYTSQTFFLAFQYKLLAFKYLSFIILTHQSRRRCTLEPGLTFFPS